MTQEWRASWPRYLAFARAGLIVIGIATLAGVICAIVSTTALLAIAPLEVVIVGTGSIAFASQAPRIHRTRLRVDSDTVTWLGVFSRRALSRADLRGVQSPVSPPSMSPTMMITATDGRQRIRLVGGIWDESDPGRIAVALALSATPVPMTDGTLVFDGVRGASADGDVIEVQLDSRYSSIELTGECES